MKLVVTGGAGFIGSNFVHYMLDRHPDWEIFNLDNLTYAGNLENLTDIENNPRYHFIKGSISDRDRVDPVLRQKVDILVNFAAESHVDRSIMDASPFIETNIRGTQTLLDSARQFGLNRFIQVSTDEVYGSPAVGTSDESAPLLPNSPYAASKTAADLLCRSYYQTYNLPVIITRCSNNFGPFQFPEKLIPLVISNALEGKNIPVYGDGLNTREWIYVTDHCSALDRVISAGKVGEIYNVTSGNGIPNLELIKMILDRLHKPHDLIKFVADRAGHDRRYALDASKIARDIGWTPAISFADGLSMTVSWYLDHKTWWQRIKSGEYADYYKKQYGGR